MLGAIATHAMGACQQMYERELEKELAAHPPPKEITADDLR